MSTDDLLFQVTCQNKSSSHLPFQVTWQNTSFDHLSVQVTWRDTSSDHLPLQVTCLDGPSAAAPSRRAGRRGVGFRQRQRHPERIARRAIFFRNRAGARPMGSCAAHVARQLNAKVHIMSHSNQSFDTKTTATVVTSTTVQPDEGAYLASFERVEAEIRAIAEDALQPINIDIPTAVTTVVGAMDEILAQRDAIAKLGDFDLSLVDNLKDFAQAAGHAHGLYRIAIGSKDPITKLGQEVTGIRDLLFSDALALSKRGLLSETVVTPLRSPSGHRNIAYDTISLVALFRENARALAGKTPVTAEELNGAVRIAEELLAALGERDQAPATSAAAVLLRQQAFTLFVNAYDQVRRAISYLRWNDDAESIAPSLWAGRGKRATVEAAPPATIAPATPGAGTVTPNPPPPITPHLTPTSAAPIGVGFPGSSPFTS